MAIYTRAGDKGKTCLLGGKRVLKSNLRIECLGSIDELNCAIGTVLGIRCKVSSEKQELENIQKDLIKVGSLLANTKYSIPDTKYFSGRIKSFEKNMDRMDKQLPEIKNFILPGGGEVGARLHLARTICRRTERRIVELNNKEKINKNILAYFNRLSDLLFTMARFANFKEKKKELKQLV